MAKLKEMLESGNILPVCGGEDDDNLPQKKRRGIRILEIRAPLAAVAEGSENRDIRRLRGREALERLSNECMVTKKGLIDLAATIQLAFLLRDGKKI